MDWGDDDDALGATDFLAQLEAEQYQQGISTVNLGAFEGAEDELALSDASSEESDEDDTMAEELLDLDDDEIIDKMSFFKRITNRISKPRYLTNYFLGAIAAQVVLYIALFVSQAAVGQTNQTIFLVVIAAMLLAALEGVVKIIATADVIVTS